MAEPFGAPRITPARVESGEDVEQAYRRVEAEILSLAPDEVGRVTADVAYAASIALGALKNLETLRPEFERLSGASPRGLAALDHLKDYALAALHAHLLASPQRTQAELQSLIEEARPLREKLLVLAEALANFNLIDSELVVRIRAGSGTRDLANDLLALATLFRANWEQLKGQAPLEEAMLTRAAALGPMILAAAGERVVGSVGVEVALDAKALEARAFRVLVRAYEELRRCTAFVRWYEDDLNAYAPSLHARSSGRPPRVARADAETTAPSEAATNGSFES